MRSACCTCLIRSSALYSYGSAASGCACRSCSSACHISLRAARNSTLVAGSIKVGGFGFVVLVAVLVQHVLFAAEAGRRGRLGFVFVRRAVLELLAEEFAVAQAQQLLVDAEAVGVLGELVRLDRRPCRDQRFGVDDDLPLAAEVGRCDLLHRAFEAFAQERRYRPASAGSGWRCWRAAALARGDRRR